MSHESVIQFTFVITYLVATSPRLYGYRDGARENSCYNHSIDHGNRSFLLDCNPTSCRYSLIIKEVLNDTRLELGNETEYYECGKIYGVEVANSLNPPEGFLVQARSGPEDSSDIIGTFLDPNVVQERDPNTRINYKILECRSRASDTKGELLDNSATHPDTVNAAGKIQLFWQAPLCSTCGLRDVYMWFTIVQQLLIGYHPSKSTILRLQNYDEPQECPSITVSSMLTPTSTNGLISDKAEVLYPNIDFIVGVSIGAVLMWCQVLL